MKRIKNRLTLSLLLASGLTCFSSAYANTVGENEVTSRDITQNKVLEYEFETDDVYNENGVNYVKDISGNNRDAKLMGNAVANGVLDLKANTASGFSTNGYAIAPEGTLDGLKSYTFFMMVKPEHLNSSPRIYDFGGSAGNSLFGRASALTAGMKFNDGGTQMVNSGRSLNIGQENYLAFVFDASTKITRIYLNGSEVANGDAITHEPNEITSVIKDSRNYIGRTQWWDSGVASSNIDYCGTIDHFQLYDIALTTEEIRDLQRPYSEPEIIDSYSGMSVTKEGAWCWFADPRALHYEDAESGINSSYIGYIDVHGNVKAMQYDFASNTSSEVLIRSYFQPDDHNNPTFLVLPDKRIMIFYSRHTDEACFYYRVSTRPGDISSLGEEKVIKTSHNTTYPSPFILADDPEHIYLCWRGINWHPTIAQLTLPDENDDVEFSWGPYQMVQSTGARPYAKYYSNGKDKLYLTYTTGHPDNESPNYVYFNMVDIKTLTLQDVNGNTLSTIANGPFKVYKTSSYVSSYPNTVVDNPSNQRDWVWQVSEDKEGKPVIAMVRISPDKTSHDYYYAQWTGSQWKKTFLANAGGHFHQTPGLEMCYSAGMAIDPEKPNEIYCSVPVMGVYEIIKYVVSEDGSLTSEAVTRNSLKNNVRPYILPGYKGEEPQLVWMYGEYYDWIVSSSRPQGYPTEIRRGFDFAETATDIESGIVTNETFDGEISGNAKTENGTLICTESSYAEIACNSMSEFSVSLSPYIYSGTYGGKILETGNITYSLNKDTWKPEIKIGDTVYKSSSVLGNSDCWQNEGRGTGGQWPTPEKLKYFNLTITYSNGVLTSYINGLIDQKIYTDDVEMGNVNIGGFNGWVEDARIYGRAINQAEVMELTGKSIAYTLDEELISELELQNIYVPATAVTDIILPAKSSTGIAIEWTSDKENVISDNGCVTHPYETTDVTLTATISGNSKQYTVTVLPRDIEQNKVVAYTFETDDCYEADGKTFVKDMSGNNNDIQIMGSAVIDGTLNLTANTATGFASNGYAIAPAGLLDSIRSYTFVLEVTPKNLNGQPRLYDFGSSSGNSVFGRGSKLTAGIKYNWQSTKMVDSNKSLTIGSSNIVAFVYDAKTKVTKIYVNGVASGSGSNITDEVYQLAEISADNRNYIGRTQWWDSSEKNNNQDFCGKIDNFYMFNTALSEEEIKDLNNTITGIGTTNIDNEDFAVYPGIIGKNEPATVGYEFSEKELNGLSISVIDMNGRTVKQITPKSNPVVIEGLKTSGCYIIKATNAYNNTWTSKIIVR